MLNNIPVLYEDDWLVIVEKPPGLLTEPASSGRLRCLTDILNEDLKNNGKDYHLYPCHRLDKETSGLIMYAKGKPHRDQLMLLFKNRKISKIYIAFVQGVLTQDQGEIVEPIDGKPSCTVFKVLERRREFSVVEIRPQTGRTNQIRIHFRSIGHPLVGESKFAFRKEFTLRSKRTFLHAQYLEFKHPQTEKIVKIKSPLARDMQKFLEDHA